MLRKVIRNNFDRFVNIDQGISHIVRHFDDLFLSYNIDREDMLILEQETVT